MRFQDHFTFPGARSCRANGSRFIPRGELNQPLKSWRSRGKPVEDSVAVSPAFCFGPRFPVPPRIFPRCRFRSVLGSETCGRGTECFVAQICNLLYRRIAFGRPLTFPTPSPMTAAGGLQIRDTADYKSALRAEAFAPHLPGRFNKNCGLTQRPQRTQRKIVSKPLPVPSPDFVAFGEDSSVARTAFVRVLLPQHRQLADRAVRAPLVAARCVLCVLCVS
jgi:hypothetical protein